MTKDLKKMLKDIFSTLVPFVFLTLLTECNPDDDVINPNDLDKWTYFNRSQGLPSNNIFTLYEDKSDRIWIGTDGGLSVYDGTSFTNYTTADGLVSNNVYAIVEDIGGKIWTGSAEGLNVLIDGQWFYFPDFYGIAINALLQLSGNDFLIATEGFGVYRYNYDINTISTFSYSNNCAPCNNVLSLYRDSEENIWIGSFGGARRVKNNTSLTFNTSNGLSGNIVTDFVEDSFGHVWVGCFNAPTLSKIKENSTEKINFSNGAEESLTFALEKDVFDNIWIGTGVFGLYRYDGAVVNRTIDGHPGNTIRALLNDRNGNLWVGSSSGLAKYLPSVN